MEHLHSVTQRSGDVRGEKSRALLFHQQISLASTTSTLSFARETQSNTNEVMTTSEWSGEEAFSGELSEGFQLHHVAQSCTTSQVVDEEEGAAAVTMTTSPRLSRGRKMTAYGEQTTYHLIRGHANDISQDTITKECSLRCSEKPEACLAKKAIGEDPPKRVFYQDQSHPQHSKSSLIILSSQPSPTSPHDHVKHTTTPVTLQWENAKRLAFQHQEPPPQPSTSSPSQPYRSSGRPLNVLEPFPQPHENLSGEESPALSSRDGLHETSWIIPQTEQATGSKKQSDQCGLLYNFLPQQIEEKCFAVYEKQVNNDETIVKQEAQFSWVPMVYSPPKVHPSQNLPVPAEVQAPCPVLPLVETSEDLAKGPYPLPEIIPCLLPYFAPEALVESFHEERPTPALSSSTMIQGNDMTPFYVPAEHSVTAFQSMQQAEQCLMDTELYFPDSETAGAILWHSSSAFYATTQTISSQHLTFQSLSYQHSSPSACFPVNVAEPHRSHDMSPTLMLPHLASTEDPLAQNALHYVARRTPRIVKRYTKRQPSAQTNSPYKESFLKRCFLSLLSSKEEKSKESLA